MKQTMRFLSIILLGTLTTNVRCGEAKTEAKPAPKSPQRAMPLSPFVQKRIGLYQQISSAKRTDHVLTAPTEPTLGLTVLKTAVEDSKPKKRISHRWVIGALSLICIAGGLVYGETKYKLLTRLGAHLFAGGSVIDPVTKTAQPSWLIRSWGWIRKLLTSHN